MKFELPNLDFLVWWLVKKTHLAVLDPENKSLNGLFSLLNIRHPKKFKPFGHWLSEKNAENVVNLLQVLTKTSLMVGPSMWFQPTWKMLSQIGSWGTQGLGRQQQGKSFKNHKLESIVFIETLL